MRGRVFTIKKSTWLLISLIINSLTFIILSSLSVVLFTNYNNIFFLFSVFTGLHHIIKGILFKLDSSSYLGILLLTIGGSYFYCSALDITWLYSVFILLSFAVASYTVGVYFYEPFQIYLAFSLFFVSLTLLLFILNILSVWIFVALTAVCVLLLIIRFFTL